MWWAYIQVLKTGTCESEVIPSCQLMARRTQELRVQL